MWLLSTDRAALHPFQSDPNLIPDGFAILSHVWGPHEQTFQEVMEINRRCRRTGENPRDHVSEKLRECCKLAKRHGYQWVWVDTCCIDKTSSAELSEAINSMFQYYSRADVCYAYLQDVPSDDVLQCESSAFRRSTWHTRGWTLQELVAPALLVFVAADWEILGTKGELAPLVEEVTLIPAAVLRLEKPVYEVGVAKRMSWAAKRRTTRLEDEAYSLMGIFGIHMPTLYGEGRQAFRRLQEEIMKLTMDTSLFVWGPSTAIDALSSAPRYCDMGSSHSDPYSFLFAPSPAAFAVYSDIRFDPPWNVETDMVRGPD